MPFLPDHSGHITGGSGCTPAQNSDHSVMLQLNSSRARQLRATLGAAAFMSLLWAFASNVCTCFPLAHLVGVWCS